MAYAETLTRDYLEYLGITDVLEDGTKIMKGGQELTQHPTGDYKTVSLYDPAIRQATSKEDRTNVTGQLHLGVHRIVYCWYNRIIPKGLVVDHKDNNKLNNHIDNLQLLTPGDNIWKDRECCTKEVPCKLNKPREYYEKKLAKYEALYEEAKTKHNAEEAHKQRANIANTRARLRYYDSHREEATTIMTQKHITEADKAAWRQSVKERKILEQYKIMFREAGNKNMWRQMIRVINQWDTLEQIQKDHVFDTLHKFFNKYGISF